MLLAITLGIVAIAFFSGVLGAVVMGVGYAWNLQNNARYSKTNCTIIERNLVKRNNECFDGRVIYETDDERNITKNVQDSASKCPEKERMETFLNETYPIGLTVSCYTFDNGFLFELPDPCLSFIAGLVLLSLTGVLFLSSLVIGIVICLKKVVRNEPIAL